MKILNLYCGIGGNRKLWGDEHEVTGVELDWEILKVYKELFPKDMIVCGDAHQYLKDHYEEFDFIWTSPPCTTHCEMAKLTGNNNDERSGNASRRAVYPDMKLYEEVLFLQNYFKGKYVVENVIPYYKPLIPAQEFQRHLFWANFMIAPIEVTADNIKHGKVKEWEKNLGYDLSKYKGLDKRKVLRNCVKPELGKHILDCMLKPMTLL